MSTAIVGSGITGLMAANLMHADSLYEASRVDECIKNRHKAILRFRSPAVGNTLGVPFREVEVSKGVYMNGSFIDPNIAIMNSYSLKVTGKLRDRSIRSVAIEPYTKRWVAPDDFIDQLLEKTEKGIDIKYGTFITPASRLDLIYDNIIWTAPLFSAIWAFLGDTESDSKFQYSDILTKVYKIKAQYRSDIHQTIYFPGHETPVYRASITGDKIIVEICSKENFMPNIPKPLSSEIYSRCLDRNMGYVFSAFGLLPMHISDRIESTPSRYGKILPLEDDAWRRGAIRMLTEKNNVYCLGRFGTWRNILLDDVLNDIEIIKRLISAKDDYERALKSSNF